MKPRILKLSYKFIAATYKLGSTTPKLPFCPKVAEEQCLRDYCETRLREGLGGWACKADGGM